MLLYRSNFLFFVCFASLFISYCYSFVTNATENQNFTNSLTSELNEADEKWKPQIQDKVVEMCDVSICGNSFIYCSGRILESAMAHYLPKHYDSKTFVDKPLKYDAVVVLDKFNKKFPSNLSVADMNKEEVKQFIEENFDSENTELKSCQLRDWVERPNMLKFIKDETLKDWSLKLNGIWKNLCREMKQNVQIFPDRYSLLYVPKRFVIPGMHDTTKHMIENFVHMIKKYGFVPNGGRVYYLQRSQPPLLAAMIYEYYKVTQDVEFLKQVLPALEKELLFWDTRRSINVTKEGKMYQLYQYRTESNVPRPESYREDINLVEEYKDINKKRQIWQDIASAAESGWDFSTRWLNDSSKLSSIQTTSILPLDLNAFICWNLRILSYLFNEIGNNERGKYYEYRLKNFMKSFQKVFYSKQSDGWYDYNLKTEDHNYKFYASFATPLFTKCYHSFKLGRFEKIFEKMNELGVFDFAGGVPTRWDYPNGWSPLNHMVIEGLRKSPNLVMQEKGFWLAEKWVLSNYKVYLATNGKMWENYNVIGTKPEIGERGEYEVQSGFGWTNGVILDLLVTYADRMKFEELDKNPEKVFLQIVNENPSPSRLSENFTGMHN